MGWGGYCYHGYTVVNRQWGKPTRYNGGQVRRGVGRSMRRLKRTLGHYSEVMVSRGFDRCTNQMMMWREYK